MTQRKATSTQPTPRVTWSERERKLNNDSSSLTSESSSWVNFGVKFAVNFAPKSTTRKFYQPINGLNSKVNNMATGAVAIGKFSFIIRKWLIMKYLKYFLFFF